METHHQSIHVSCLVTRPGTNASCTTALLAIPDKKIRTENHMRTEADVSKQVPSELSKRPGVFFVVQG